MLESVRTIFRTINQKNKCYFQNFSDKNLINLWNTVPSTLITPSRTTIIVKRRYPPTLVREGNKPRLRKRTFYYDYVENTDNRPEPLIDVVLSSYVQGVGNAGDMISMKRSVAYNRLLVTGLADYATPEMIEISKKLKADLELQGKQFSPSEERCMNFLQSSRISMKMNQHNDWTIEPWHVRVSARRAGIHILSDDSIEIPSKPIKGPDMALEGKSFFATVTINKKGKVKVQCTIHHWTPVLSEQLPLDPEWYLAPPEMIFPEDEQDKIDNSTQTSPSQPTRS